VRRYLIVGPSWVGDMVMAQSLFKSLKKKHPDCSIDVIAPGWSLPILYRMPEINNCHELKARHGEFAFAARIKLGKSLREKEYTHAIIIPRSWKSALVPYAAKIPVRTGYRGEMRYGLLNDIRPLDKTVLTQTVQRYVALGLDESVNQAPAILHPALKIDLSNLGRLQNKLKLNMDKPVICFMPGAEYGPAKQWPVEYYAELAKKLVAAGYYVWVMGSDRDTKAGKVIVSYLDGSAWNLCGETELVDTADLFSCAKEVVTNDSGLMHVAAAVGVKINAIYGSSTPDYTPPLIDKSNKKIFYLGLSCSPCFKRLCPLGHTDCLRKVDVESVYKKISTT